MLWYLARHLAQYALVLAVALTINFALPRLAPGDPLDYLLGQEAQRITPEQRQKVLAQFGLDRSVAEQYQVYISGIARGDLGTSVRFGRPVTQVLVERLPWTVALVGTAIVLATLIGALTGMLAARHRGASMDIGTLALFMFLDAIPAFWLGMLLVVIFSVELRWFPIFGAIPVSSSNGPEWLAEVFRRLVLPVVTLTAGSIGGTYLVARASMLSVLGEDYILMAEAKGLSERRIVFHHALRNAILPVVTLTMLNVGTLLGGATVVETVFSYPGLGRLVYESVLARDYPLLQGAFLLLAVGVIGSNLLADLIYPLLDPRIRRRGVVS